MLGKFIIWIIQKIYVGKVRRLFNKDRIIAVQGLLKNYNSTYHLHESKKNRATYLKEFKKLGILTEDFENEVKKVLNSISTHTNIHNDVYLLLIFIRTCRKDTYDLRKTQSKEHFDEMISNVDYLVFNYKL
tara:strand:- start:99 stop:491 length:393 start_codon:yes stop_codon:yes gene_type:complete